VPFRDHTAEIELLYEKHGSALLLFATVIAGDRARAQDAVHHVFLKLIEGCDLSHVADSKAYLFASVRHAALNDAKSRRGHFALEEESAWFTPPQRDYAAELNLRRALCALPEEQRQVVVLHVWGECTFLQAADILGISANTAASRYRYALSRLREAMTNKEDSCANPAR
jgi:RNA polymerase sigma-70 factor (ECF subfamily)